MDALFFLLRKLLKKLVVVNKLISCCLFWTYNDVKLSFTSVSLNLSLRSKWM